MDRKACPMLMCSLLLKELRYLTTDRGPPLFMGTIYALNLIYPPKLKYTSKSYFLELDVLKVSPKFSHCKTTCLNSVCMCS